MRIRTLIATVCAASATLGGSALAQENTPPPGQLPAADEPIVKPERMKFGIEKLTLEAGGGILGFVSGAGAIGPAWSARASYPLSSHVVLEGNYNGSVNKRPVINTKLVSTLIDADVRYNLVPADAAPVQPYVVAGVGWGGFAGDGGDMGTLIIPLSVGAERALTSHIKVGARFTFRPAFFDDLSFSEGVANGLSAPGSPGADTYELVASVGGNF